MPLHGLTAAMAARCRGELSRGIIPLERGREPEPWLLQVEAAVPSGSHAARPLPRRPVPDLPRTTPMRRKSPTPFPPGAQTRRRLQEAADPGRVHWSTRSARKTTRPTPPALRLRRSRSSRQPRTRCSPHAPTLASARKLGPPTGTPSSYSQLRLCPPHPVSLEPNLHSPRRSVPRSLTTRTNRRQRAGGQRQPGTRGERDRPVKAQARKRISACRGARVTTASGLLPTRGPMTGRIRQIARPSSHPSVGGRADAAWRRRRGRGVVWAASYGRRYGRARE